MKPLSLSEFLQNYLTEHNISQIILSQDTGISTKTINAIYTGRQQSIDAATAIKLEQATRIDARKWLDVVTEWQLSEARQQCR